MTKKTSITDGSEDVVGLGLMAGHAVCFHCGTPCRDAALVRHDKAFCCPGCLTVFELLTENGLAYFYQLGQSAGVRVRDTPGEEPFNYLDEPAVRERLVDFADARITRVTFRIPAIHCIACVWLLENLFRLKPGIGQSRVNFPRRELAVTFETAKVKLSETVALLASLGYEPELKWSDLERRPRHPPCRRLWLQLGVAGFAFGNIMLFSISSYLGLDRFNGPDFKRLFGYLSLGLALPVFFYSAADYWRAARVSIRQRALTIEVPLAAGIAALFAQSVYEVLSGRGEGYFDSLAGLLFFLLCGRLFQRKTYDRLAFDRDYKSFFPLSVTRKRPGRRTADRPGVAAGVPPAVEPGILPGGLSADICTTAPASRPGSGRQDAALYGGQDGHRYIGRRAVNKHRAPVRAESNASEFNQAESEFGAPEEERVSLSVLQVGDRLVIRHGELIPADARLVEGPAVIDYSFVTGESEPRAKPCGDYLYAGGRQLGGAIEVELLKPVSQSYLTSLWNQEAFRKPTTDSLDTLTNRYSRRFTKMVIAIAVAAAVFWLFRDPGRSVKSFTSVLIVACPCALALAAPFALGTAQRVLARRNVFLKNPSVFESLARVGTVVFDKTGTLTAAGAAPVVFDGPPLSAEEERWLYSLTRHSTHPHAARIGQAIARDHVPDPVRSFLETTGGGIEGNVAGNEIRLGSAAWLQSRNIARPGPGRRPGDDSGRAAPQSPTADLDGRNGSVVHVAVNGRYRGCYLLAGALRPQMDRLIDRLAANYELTLLSGDHDKQRGRFQELFGPRARLHFNQSPLDKLRSIRRLQRSRRTVMMVGDGLNDAGALKQSDVGVAVVEDIGAFSPASDVIISGGMVARLPEVLDYAKTSVRIVRLSFLISSIYNIVGISIAARGLLSPVVCAILMPLSSVTVVAFACGMTAWLGQRQFDGRRRRREASPTETARNADALVRSSRNTRSPFADQAVRVPAAMESAL